MKSKIEMVFKKKILKYHNEYRTKHDAGALVLDKALEKKAKKLSEAAVRDKGFDVVTAGESVYEVCATFRVVVTPKQVVKSWYVYFIVLFAFPCHSDLSHAHQKIKCWLEYDFS